MKKCFYEVLNVDTKATGDEIKKAYRLLALRYHPDKNRNNEENAQAHFLLIQEAYETLSDPQERAWYDGHKNQILRGEDNVAGGEDQSSNRINVYRWFRKDCYNGFDEFIDGHHNANCFFTVYRHVFDVIVEEELKNSENEGSSDYLGFKNAPSFGTSKVTKEVNQFYVFWSKFSTQRNFNFANEWNLSEAPNRYIKRQMEAENKKKRKDARKEFNESIRALVAFVKKRDPRIASIALEKTAEAKRQAEEEAEKRRLRDIERQEQRKTALLTEEKRWEELRKEKECAMSNQHFLQESESESDEEQPSIAYVCEACRKTFKSNAQFQSHQKSKKHQQAVIELLRRLEAESASIIINNQDASVSGSDVRSQVETISDGSEELLEEIDTESELEPSSIIKIQSSDGSSTEIERPLEQPDHAIRSQLHITDTDDSDSTDNDELLERLKEMRIRRANQRGRSSSGNVTESSNNTMPPPGPTLISAHESTISQPDELVEDANESKRRRRRKQKDNSSETHPLLSSTHVTLNAADTRTIERCSICNAEFTSRNKLFQHIKATKHASNKVASSSSKKSSKK